MLGEWNKAIPPAVRNVDMRTANGGGAIDAILDVSGPAKREHVRSAGRVFTYS